MLIKEVRKDRRKSKNNPSAADEYDITNMLNEIIELKFFENDYNKVTEKLLYEKMTYTEAIESGIKKLIRKKCFNKTSSK